MYPLNIVPLSIYQFILLIVAIGLLSGCNDHSTDVETFLPKPEWLDSVGAPVLNSVDDVTTLWRSKKRCCISDRKLKNNQQEFYKACYVAVATHSKDQLLVAKCLQLMDSGMDEDVRYRINKHFVDNYFELKSPIDRCSNCLPADPIARSSRDLAWQESRRGNPQSAINIAQRVLDERIDEISPHVQLNLYAALAYFYAETGYSAEQLSSLKQARDRLLPYKDANGASKGNFKTFNRYLGDLLEG